METTTVVNIWQKSKLLIKASIIGVLVLLMLIPSSLVQGLVIEREATQQQAFREIASRWAGKQNVSGPILAIPYVDSNIGPAGRTPVKKTAYVLPESLTIESDVKPEKKHRGIYQVMLYSASVNMKGKFSAESFQLLNLPPENILWNEATVSVGLTDAKGLQDDLKLQWNQQELSLAPGEADKPVVNSGFESAVKLVPGQPIEFSTSFRINGSEQLLFTPVGKETTVRMVSGWSDPSFTGTALPMHQISDSGFKATWKSLPHNRPFPQVWKETAYDLGSSAFGADLFIQVNNYQKILRSVKYAFLCIVLTFAAFFLVEINSRKAIHPIQYGLVGLALVLFYTLLLSISEYVGFDLAYLIASIATIGLIAWFVGGLLHSARLTSVISIVMLLLYSYIFCILQVQEYSLLLGSIGLFLTLAVVMRFSKKLQW